MKVLVLAKEYETEKLLDDLSGIDGEVVFIHGENALDVQVGPAEADVILCGASGVGSSGSILAWRCHHHAYLIPCWFACDRETLSRACLWPHLAIDRFDSQCGEKSFSQWLLDVAQWQHNRLLLGDGGDVGQRSALELATALSLRKATGLLSVFDDSGAEGEFLVKDGDLLSASFKALSDEQAFYELLCATGGRYVWSEKPLSKGGEPRPLSVLIAQGLKVISEANFLYHFASNPEQHLMTTDSQSALDDSAIENYSEQKKLYGLIEKGVSLSRVLGASSLSKPSTMAILAKWFSLEDISVVAGQLPVIEEMSLMPSVIDESSLVCEKLCEPECRVLIVDDSSLICNVLRKIFEEDPRMSVAGIAHDGLEAIRMVGEQKPDVVTMDLQMPRMDGLTALKHILIRDPRPVVVLSALTEATSRLTYESFKYGAVDVMQKPPNAANQSGGSNNDFCDRVVLASRIQLDAVRYIRRNNKSEAGRRNVFPEATGDGTEKVVVLICGAGGAPSLIKLLFAIPSLNSLPLCVLGVDMPWQVSEALITNLKQDTALPLERVAGAGPLSPGRFHVVSNEIRYRLLEENKGLKLEKFRGDSASEGIFDLLLSSAAKTLNSRLVAVALSGPGEDGLEGMRLVKQAGGQVFALSPGACLKPELPRKLIDLGYATEIMNIGKLSDLFDTRTNGL